MGQFIAADMIAVRLTPPFRLGVVSSPEYLRRCKRPERIDDLRQHACLRIRRSNGSIAPLVLCRWQQDSRSDRLGAPDPPRLSHPPCPPPRRRGTSPLPPPTPAH